MALNNNDDNKKSRACTECHRSKNKCFFAPGHLQQLHGGRPRCERCTRLDKECIPHLSRQGKRKQRLSVDSAASSTAGSMFTSATLNGRSPTNTPNAAMLSNQAQILDMVETSNLQQLNKSLNFNVFSNHTAMFQQQQQQLIQSSNDPLHGLANHIRSRSHNQRNKFSNAEQQDRMTSSNSLTLLLSRVNESLGNAGNSKLIGGGGDGKACGTIANNSNSNGPITPQIDPAKLNMMISHLTNNSCQNNNRMGGNGDGMIAMGGNQLNLSNYNLNMGGSSTSTMAPSPSQQSSGLGNVMGPQQPSATALMMLAGHAGTSSGMTADSTRIPTILNQLNKKINGSSRGGGEGAQSIFPARRSLSMVHGPSNSSTPIFTSPDSLGAGGRSSMPHSIGSSIINSGIGNNANNVIHQGGNAYSNDNNTIGSISESLLKKQKKAHLLPANKAPPGATAGGPSGNNSKLNDTPLPAPDPPISVHPQDKNNNNNNKNSNTDKNSHRHPPNQSFSHDINNSNNQNNLSRSSSTSNFLTPEDAIGHHISRACVKRSGQKLTSLKNHYGLQCQIREWISMSLTRRSFALLGKASSLADRCGIHMDRILCGVAENDEGDVADDMTAMGCKSNSSSSSMGGRMNYLLSTLLESRTEQITPVDEQHMLIPHLPKEILNVVGFQSSPDFQSSELHNRWIIIRETHCGTARFYTSPAFERNVLCWRHISQIYDDNLADINSLIFVKDDFHKFLACNAHQISLHSTPGMPPRPVHAPRTKIRLLGRHWGKVESGNKKSSSSGGDGEGKITKEMIRQVQDGNAMTLEMDLQFLSFPSMDRMIYYLEFFHHCRDGDSSTETGTSWTRTLSDDSLLKTANAVQQQSQQQPQSHSQQQPSVSSSNDTNSNKTMDRVVSESPSTEEPPMFDDIINNEEWVGINDVLASGDIDDLLTALFD